MSNRVIKAVVTRGYATRMILPRGEFHPWVEFAPVPGQSYRSTCSTDVKSRSYPYFAPVFERD